MPLGTRRKARTNNPFRSYAKVRKASQTREMQQRSRRKQLHRLFRTSQHNDLSSDFSSDFSTSSNCSVTSTTSSSLSSSTSLSSLSEDEPMPLLEDVSDWDDEDELEDPSDWSDSESDSGSDADNEMSGTEYGGSEEHATQADTW